MNITVVLFTSLGDAISSYIFSFLAAFVSIDAPWRDLVSSVDVVFYLGRSLAAILRGYPSVSWEVPDVDAKLCTPSFAIYVSLS